MSRILACTKPHGVIVGKPYAVSLRDIGVRRNSTIDRTAQCEHRERAYPSRIWLILICAGSQMFANRSIVAGGKDHTVWTGLLKIQVIRLRVRIPEVGVDR